MKELQWWEKPFTRWVYCKSLLTRSWYFPIRFRPETADIDIIHRRYLLTYHDCGGKLSRFLSFCPNFGSQCINEALRSSLSSFKNTGSFNRNYSDTARFFLFSRGARLLVTNYKVLFLCISFYTYIWTFFWFWTSQTIKPQTAAGVNNLSTWETNIIRWN